MKRTTSAILVAVLFAPLTGPPAFAQIASSSQYPETEAFSRTTSEVRLDAGVVARGGGLDARPLFELDGEFELESFTDGGRRWGVVLGGRLERDTDPRIAQAAAGACPAGAADCAAIEDGGILQAVQSPVTGLRTTGRPANAEVRGAIDAGYVFVDLGWGELRAGYGPGAARIDAVRGPTAFRLSRADGGRVSTSDLNGVRTANRASGFAPKLVFRSVSLGQESSIGSLRVLASFAPTAPDCDVEVCGVGNEQPGLVFPQPVDIAEFGLVYAVRRGNHEWTFSAGLAEAATRPALAGLERLTVRDAGLRWRHGSWIAGLRGLVSNNATSDGDYRAWAVSVGREEGPWIVVAEYAGFSDDLLHIDGETWQLAASRLVGDHWIWGLGVQGSERAEPHATPGGRLQRRRSSTAAFVELGWQF